MSEFTVKLFGKDVGVDEQNGSVMFEQKSFMRAVGQKRAKELFDDMEQTFGFLGPGGMDQMVSDGKEGVLCAHILAVSSTSADLRQYAMAWIEAYELMKGAQ